MAGRKVGVAFGEDYFFSVFENEEINNGGACISKQKEKK